MQTNDRAKGYFRGLNVTWCGVHVIKTCLCKCIFIYFVRVRGVSDQPFTRQQGGEVGTDQDLAAWSSLHTDKMAELPRHAVGQSRAHAAADYGWWLSNPDILVIHLGGNELTSLRHGVLLQSIKQAMGKLSKSMGN